MSCRYIALIHKDADSGFGVTVPDCPGATAMADSMDEALVRGTEALRLWAEAVESRGAKVPAPRPLDAVLADPDVAFEIGEGAVPVAIPLLADAGRYARVNITLDAGLVRAIDAAAEARGLTRSAFLASAAREKIAG